jgi:RNA polymerase sigma-70 factor (ECF subfamily)
VRSSDETSATFADWLQEYRNVPIKVARSFTANAEDRRDLLQEMYLQLWRSIKSFAGQAKASTWIYRVCLNTAMTWRRSEKRRHHFLNSANLPDFYAASEPPATEAQLEALYAAIRELRPVDRALILLYLEERSYREIGEITGITENNTGVRLQRVKRELAERLSKSSSYEP